MECREMLLDDRKARVRDLSLQNLLKPKVLQKVFSDDPAKWP
jgi:hypothetical protein